MSILGIHVGSSHSCIALHRIEESSKVGGSTLNLDELESGVLGEISTEIINNDDGDRLIPSLLAYSADGEIITGTHARQQKPRNHRSTFSHFVRLLSIAGESQLSDRMRRKESLSIVVDGEGSDCYIKFCRSDSDGGESKIAISDVLVDFLRHLKEGAERFSGLSVEAVSFTYPVEFSAVQRELFLSSAQKAGFPDVHFVPEPIAILTAYGDLHVSSVGKNIAVVDCGSVHTTASLFCIRNGVPVLSHLSSSEEATGGAISEVLTEYFADSFFKTTKLDVRESRKSMIKLRASVETVKRTLSRSQNAHISVDSLFEGADFHSSIHRMKFETISSPLLTKFERFFERFKEECECRIDKVYLVGGTALTPKVISAGERVFKDTTLVRDTNALELPAIGALKDVVCKRAFDSLMKSASPYKFKALNLATFGIGIAVLDVDGNSETVQPLVERFQPLPCSVVSDIILPKSSSGRLNVVDLSQPEALIAAIDIKASSLNEPVVRVVLNVDEKEHISMEVFSPVQSEKAVFNL